MTEEKEVIEVTRETCASHGNVKGYCKFNKSIPCRYHLPDGRCSVNCDLAGQEQMKGYKSQTEQFTFYQNINGVKEF